MFEGRKLIIATKHQKEKVIAPIVEKALDCKCFTLAQLDTDILGTFTGEVERKNDPLSTGREKCLMAMELGNYDLAIASEGSFGAHPSMFFVPANEELLVLIDKKNNLEIIARELSTETNFSGAALSTQQELEKFAAGVMFPEHGLIIRKQQNDFSVIHKGITDWETLQRLFDEFIEKYGTAFVETDMRAMFNPTRMRVIEKASLKLVEHLQSKCPNCATPGFVIKEVKSGLPCEYCQFPTKNTLSHIYKCSNCTFTEEKMFPHNKENTSQMFCDLCNP
jgi:hypothetical protein